MLRIFDARTGESVPALPARRGLARVQAHVPDADASALRVLLVCDLLVRTLELGGTTVWSVLGGGTRRPELRAAAAALGIAPFEEAQDPAAGMGGARTVHVVETGGARPDAGTVLEVAPVSGPQGTSLAAAGAPDADPAAWRLALLGVPLDTPVRLDADTLDEAGRTLARWRRAVAGWARRPSRPVPEEVRTRLHAAWEDNLDMAAALRVLEAVETGADVPDGARFETYAYADRVLGLDLVRDIGNPE